MQSEIVTNIDYILTPIYFVIFISIALIIKNNNQKNEDYKYLVRGVIFKLIGVFCFCCIYIFYYAGGDTISYFQGSKVIVNLLLNFEKGIAVFLI